jgi:Fur family transcriptional regulator, ferric uptake regulator
MKEEVAFEAVKEIFTEYLKEHKHRKTPERYAILERINEFEGHFNADSLYNVMLKDYRVSLATVYNTLELLLECKLILKHQLGGQFAQYEKAFGNTTHNHLICTNCGKVKEFTDKQLRISIQSRKFAHFYSTHYTLYLYGLCHQCKAKLKIRNTDL